MVTPDLVDLLQSPQEDQTQPPEPDIKIRQMVLVRAKTLRRGSEEETSHLPRGISNVEYQVKLISKLGYIPFHLQLREFCQLHQQRVDKHQRGNQ